MVYTLLDAPSIIRIILLVYAPYYADAPLQWLGPRKVHGWKHLKESGLNKKLYYIERVTLKLHNVCKT